MISRFFLKSTVTLCRRGEQRLSKTLLALHQKQQSRQMSTLLFTSSAQITFSSLRSLSKSTKSNKKYQVGCTAIQSVIINLVFQPISYGPKSKRPIIEVYHKMTVKALAQAMDISVGQFFGCVIFLECLF